MSRKPRTLRAAAVALLVLPLLAAIVYRFAPATLPAALSGAVDLPADSACAVILSTNDEHGGLLPSRYPWAGDTPVGGAEALAGYVRTVRETSDCPVFLVSGGDMMQGTLISNLSAGRATIEVMNEIGYDAAAIGNHEFDWGIGTLEERLEQSRFPVLGANIFVEGTNRHPKWVQPYAILEKQGVRLGVIGAATRSTPSTTHPDSVAGLEFRSIAEALDRYIPEVRAKGADFVVAVMHAGGFCDRPSEEPGSGAAATRCAGEAIDELSATKEVFDYAATGHTHSRVDDRIHGAPVVQSYANLGAIGIGRLVRYASGEVVGELEGIYPLFPDSTPASPAIARLVRHYEEEATATAEAEVMTLAEALPKTRRGGYGLGRLIADAQREAADADVAMMNNGGIRTPLPAGLISYSDIFRVQPFQTTLIRLQLSGSQLLSALEHSITDAGPRDNLSGLTVEYDPEAVAGNRIRCARLADGSILSAEAIYIVAVNNFMAAGGDGFEVFKEARMAQQTGIVDLDALVSHLRQLPQPVTAPQEPRWIAIPGLSRGCS